MSDGQHSHEHHRPPAGGGAGGAAGSGVGGAGGAVGSDVESGLGGGQECVLCPVCVLLQAVSATRPEVTRHLLAAGRELTLALQALLEQQLRAHGQEQDGLERIDVE